MLGKTQSQPDESKILQRARKFDRDALTWVYEEYHGPIYRYLYHHLGESQTAQDLSADVFRRFLQALRKGGGPTRNLSAWLYRVAHNLIVDELRRREHRDHESLDDTLGDVLQAETISLDELAGKAITVGRVRCALLTLTDEQRHVVVLKYLEGMSNAEVAEITGKTVGAVKALQHRALDALRNELEASETSVVDQKLGARGWAPSFGG
jgi:RNA polymerase sigma-70 factor (ECF subfamily)